MSRSLKVLIVAFFALGICFPVLAQQFPVELAGEESELEEGDEEEEDEIETDRDSFTPATTVAGHRRTIIELAHSFIDNRDVPETHSYPELLTRFGVSDWLELRLGWNYEVGGAGSPVSGNVPDDFGDENELERASRVLYGAKVLLTAQEGWLPQSAFLVHGFTPTSGQSNHTDMSLTYATGWTLPNDWTFDSALRYGSASLEGDKFNTWAPSTVLKIPLGEKWKIHAEYFGIFSDGREDETVQQFFSAGAHYLITKDLEIGTRVGWGLNQEAPNFFSNAGLGWRY